MFDEGRYDQHDKYDRFDGTTIKISLYSQLQNCRALNPL